MKEERHLKVYEASGPKRNVSKIHLQGDWLSDLGFHVGDNITVSCSKGKLIINLDSPITDKSKS